MKIALLSHSRSFKCAAVASALAARGVQVALIICDEPPVTSARIRAQQLILQRGPGALAGKLFARLGMARSNDARRLASGAPASEPAPAPASALASARARAEASVEAMPQHAAELALDAASYAARHAIELLHLPNLNAAISLERLRAEGIDLMIHAGAGILRAPLLAVPRLGVLNAHMGVLPRYRGMNVAEWAMWEDGPLGASLHWIDPGIDTGRIIRVIPVPKQGLDSLAAVRNAVDRAQTSALAELVLDIVATGQLPATTAQRREDGRQYFTMHGQIRQLLEQRLLVGC